MVTEMNGIYLLGMGTLGALILVFLGHRIAVPVRQKYRRGARK